MESSKKDLFTKVYKMLDEVSPVSYDCGKLCNAICCVYDEEDYSNNDLVISLFPGEELMYENHESFDVSIGFASEFEYPESWGGEVYFLKCKTPPVCDREYRPIQCRSYPLTPHLDEEDNLHLIFDESEYPYECPLIHENIDLNVDFIETTLKAWSLLIEDPLIYDFVKMDSKARIKVNRKFELVI